MLVMIKAPHSPKLQSFIAHITHSIQSRTMPFVKSVILHPDKWFGMLAMAPRPLPATPEGTHPLSDDRKQDTPSSVEGGGNVPQGGRAWLIP